ncbi:MAG: fibronectin type III domain-containing protein [Lachnospiraceae bacterium]|nr:fibronectin type III domain-containing protein [Lachnospiraceae bacterium]
MKKRMYRVFSIWMIMFVCLIIGGTAKTMEVMAKEQIKATKTMQDAPRIQIDRLYHVAANDSSKAGDADILAWYSNRWNYYEFISFELKEDMNLTLYLEETGGSNCWIQLYDSTGNKVGKEPNVGSRSGVLKREIEYSLKAGVYYFGLQPHATADFKFTSENKVELLENTIVLEKGDSTTIDAVLKRGNMVIENATFTYKTSKKSVAKVSSKGKVVAVGPGVAKITVKSNGVSAEATVIVLPKKITGVKQVGKSRKSAKISWKKQKGVSGYEVWMYDKDLEEYAKEKNVSSSFSSANIKKLKSGKTYKVRVRAYVKVGSKKYYGSFSKVYRVKTK